MQRHMQNISFIAILGVLLSCSFFFSQLTNLRSGSIDRSDLEIDGGATIPDLLECTDDMADEEALSCLAQSVVVSQQLLDKKIDEILAQETESDRRIAIVESQNAWEESRDADCGMVLVMTTGDHKDQIDQMVCMRDHNLARKKTMDENLCKWYGSPACLNDDSTLEASDINFP